MNKHIILVLSGALLIPWSASANGDLSASDCLWLMQAMAANSLERPIEGKLVNTPSIKSSEHRLMKREAAKVLFQDGNCDQRFKDISRTFDEKFKSLTEK